MNEIQAFLQRVRERVASGWCQSAVARNSQNWACEVAHPTAVKWCLTGALAREGYYADRSLTEADRTYRLGWDCLYKALDDIDPKAVSGSSLAMFNDSHTQADVLALIDRAIELAGEGE